MDSRNLVFQQLKPQCVALGQSALTLHASRPDMTAIAEQLERLYKTIARMTATPNTLDARLADYVFFPISQILKASQELSIRCLELALQIIALLVEQGWRQNIQPQLAVQIVILCTLMADSKPQGFSFDETTDDLQAAAFGCLKCTFSAAGGSLECQKIFRAEANFPQLGQSITVMLNGLLHSASGETQLQAVCALRILFDDVANRDICASFLPGIVSQLTKILTPSTKQRRSHLVLVEALHVLTSLLRTTLGDEQTRSTPAGELRKATDEKWRASAATQLKPALTSIMRLKSHSRDDVKQKLADLCLMLLEHCQANLTSCSSLALETALGIASEQPREGAINTKLAMMLRADASLGPLLQETVFDWLQSLPTAMQSTDEQAKLLKLQQLCAAYELLVDGDIGTATLDRALASSIRDSVAVTIQQTTMKDNGPAFAAPVGSLHQKIAIPNSAKGNIEFGQPLVRYRAQEDVIKHMERLTQLISISSTPAHFMGDVARSLRHAQGDVQIANLWLLLVATRTTLQQKDSISDFLALPKEGDMNHNEHLEELYAFSLSVLTGENAEPTDTRLQALALQSLALRAQTAGRDFRYELIDALYPVLHTLATPHDQLQVDSMVTLNIFANACGYSSVKELIVENIDYLTNAVALKLNAFDVSPQAPQVLLMMVRLAGPGLLPYLEDTVESIFAALEDYHGYPLLVEMLFRVLTVIAEEGAKARQLAITKVNTKEVETVLGERWAPTPVHSLGEMLSIKAAEDAESNTKLPIKTESAPQRPWKAKVNSDRVTAEDDETNDESHEQSDGEKQVDDEDPPPPVPKTYNLLIKITELTQHFLPSASASLRASLLSLIRTTIPAIARHENSFLPLIHTLWPEIVTRMDDGESYVQATALEIIGELCEYAGDFMRTRIEQVWPAIVEMYQNTAKDIVAASKANGSITSDKRKLVTSSALVPTGLKFKQAIRRLQAAPSDYSDTSARLLWDAIVGALAMIVKAVALPPELFDEALEMLEPVLAQRQNLQEVLEEENADAVWLIRLKSGIIAAPTPPEMHEGENWTFVAVAG